MKKITQADRILKNNAVQTLIKKEDEEELFLDGFELWYFLDDYTEVEYEDEDWMYDYDEEQDFIDDQFPMSCISLGYGDTIESIVRDKYFLPK